jgi:Protein of unknown function (DUF541)
MKSAIAAIMTLAAGLFAANMLGVAVAEAPTVTPGRTVSVEGVANVPIAQGENAAGANAVYRQGMAAAVADAQNKAEFLASKLGGTLGAVQSIAEGGGNIECTGTVSEEGYARYEGEQPDFGTSSPRVVAAPLAASRPATVRRKTPAKRKKRTTAKKATAASCTLSTNVSLVYTLQ